MHDPQPPAPRRTPCPHRARHAISAYNRMMVATIAERAAPAAGIPHSLLQLLNSPAAGTRMPHLLLQLGDLAHAVTQERARLLHMRNVVSVAACRKEYQRFQVGEGAKGARPGALGAEEAARQGSINLPAVHPAARGRQLPSGKEETGAVQHPPQAAVAAVLASWVVAAGADGPGLVPPVAGREACRHLHLSRQLHGRCMQCLDMRGDTVVRSKRGAVPGSWPTHLGLNPQGAPLPHLTAGRAAG